MDIELTLIDKYSDLSDFKTINKTEVKLVVFKWEKSFDILT